MPIIQFTLFTISRAKLSRTNWRSSAEFMYFLYSDSHDDAAAADDDDNNDDGISLKSTINIVVFAVLLQYAKAMMTWQIVKNPEISTNLKNLPRWKFLDRRQRHIWGKDNDWWLNIWTINDCTIYFTHVVCKKLLICRNTLGTNLNLEAHKAFMQHQHETRCYTHVNGKAIVKHSMFLKQRSWIHGGEAVFLCPFADVCEYTFQSPNHANH